MVYLQLVQQNHVLKVTLLEGAGSLLAEEVAVPSVVAEVAEASVKIYNIYARYFKIFTKIFTKIHLNVLHIFIFCVIVYKYFA